MAQFVVADNIKTKKEETKKVELFLEEGRPGGTIWLKAKREGEKLSYFILGITENGQLHLSYHIPYFLGFTLSRDGVIESENFVMLHK